jgi:PAS domain-containing protein
MLARHDPDEPLNTALNALAAGPECRAMLDQIPVPIYTTDMAGRVTYWNRACVDFAGREPKLGEDQWCVTWQVFTMTGEALGHEDCPMAEAMPQRTPIRDLIAIAERPDRSRVAFRAYPPRCSTTAE